MGPNPATAERRSHRVGVVLAAILVLAVTLWPLPAALPSTGAQSFWCIDCGVQPFADFLLNIALFVPVGIALSRGGSDVARAMLLGGALSLLIEFAQLIVPGRDPSVRDVVANAGGAALGALIWSRRSMLVNPAPPSALRYGLIAATLAWLTLISGYALLQPSVPAGTYFGQWAPRFFHRAYFDGQLLDATLGGKPLPQGPEQSPGQLHQSLGDGLLLLDARIVPGSQSWAFAPIAAVVDDQRREIAALGQLGNDAVFRARTRGAALGLATPAVRIHRALDQGRDTALISGERTRDGISVTVRDQRGDQHAALRMSPGLSWVLLQPGERPAGRETPWVSAAWVALLVLPGAYWLARSGRRLALASYALLLALALLALPAAWNAAVAPWWELLGTGGGIFAGRRLGRR